MDKIFIFKDGHFQDTGFTVNGDSPEAIALLAQQLKCSINDLMVIEYGGTPNE